MTSVVPNLSRQAGPFPFRTPADITLEPKPFLIEGFVGIGEMSAWYGAPDSGKSCVILDAGCHVAAGLSWCDRRVQQGAVLYFAAERGAVVKRRVVAWCRHHGHTDILLGIVTEPIDLRSSQNDADRIIATAQAFAATYRQEVVWIIIDTLNRTLAGGDENSSKDTGVVIAALDRIQRATGAHVSVIHHVPVDRTDRMRGHGSVLGAVDLTVRITKANDAVTVEADKANDLVERPRHAFRFESVELMRDEETGQSTTAPVLMPIDGPAPKPAPKRKLSDKQKLALEALNEVVLSHGKAADPSWQLPQGAAVAPIDNWRQELLDRNVIDLGGANPREDFRRILQQLASRHLIGTHGEFVWPSRS